MPKLRVNLTRFHGVFAPNNKHLALVTSAKRGKGNKCQENSEPDDCTTAKRHAALAWEQRLKRVFNIDITTGETCGVAVKVMPKAITAQFGRAFESLTAHRSMY